MKWLLLKKQGRGRRNKFPFPLVLSIVGGVLVLVSVSLLSAQIMEGGGKGGVSKQERCVIIFDPPELEKLARKINQEKEELKRKEIDILKKTAYLKSLEEKISENLAEAMRIRKEAEETKKFCIAKLEEKERENKKTLEELKSSYERKISDIASDCEMRIKKAEEAKIKDCETKISELRKEVEASRKEIDSLKKRYESMLSDIDKKHKSELADIDKKHKSELEAIRISYEKEITKERDEAKNKIAELQKKLDEMEKNYQAKLDEVQKRQQAEIAKLKSEYEKSLTSLRSEYESRISNTVQDYERKIKELELKKTEEISSLRSSFEKTLETVVRGYENQINSLLDIIRERERGEKQKGGKPEEERENQGTGGRKEGVMKERQEGTEGDKFAKQMKDERIRKMANIILNTPPEDAAKIMSVINDEEAAQILSMIDERVAGKILSLLPSDKAKSISDYMLGLVKKEEDAGKKKRIQRNVPFFGVPEKFPPEQEGIDSPEKRSLEENIEEPEGFYENPRYRGDEKKKQEIPNNIEDLLKRRKQIKEAI